MQNVMVADGLRVHTIPKVGSGSIDHAVRPSMTKHSLPDEPGEEYRWMAVRHPLDRLVSCWAYFAARGGGPRKIMQGIGCFTSLPFNEFCARVLPDPSLNSHTRPQIDHAGPFKIDRLCRLENLDSEWEGLRRRFRYLPSMGRANKTDHDPWADYYTPAQRTAAEATFAADMALYEASEP